jgi:hypothetical protein
MRGLLAFVGVLCLLGAAQRAYSREAQDFEASEQAILECVESAEKVRLQAGGDVTRQCIGRETRRCRESTDAGDRAIKEMFCASAEGVAWFAIMGKAYASLLERTAKNDEESKTQRAVFDPALPIALPLLKEAHEVWLAGSADCVFLQARAGVGTDRYDAPARCGRDRTAERALLYRQWLGR